MNLEGPESGEHGCRLTHRKNHYYLI